MGQCLEVLAPGRSCGAATGVSPSQATRRHRDPPRWLSGAHGAAPRALDPRPRELTPRASHTHTAPSRSPRAGRSRPGPHPQPVTRSCPSQLGKSKAGSENVSPGPEWEVNHPRKSPPSRYVCQRPLRPPGSASSPPPPGSPLRTSAKSQLPAGREPRTAGPDPGLTAPGPLASSRHLHPSQNLPGLEGQWPGWGGGRCR